MRPRAAEALLRGAASSTTRCNRSADRYTESIGISLRPQHLKRYRDIAWLLVKYGRSDLARNAGLEQILQEERPANGVPAAPEANALANDLERLGPTFIKLGQLLSTRPDLLPAQYLAALTRLQDKIEPFPFAEVERIVASALGVRMSKAFAEFEPSPMAAASLGQVHRARLRNGRRVAVKVQRPGIRERVVEDLDALGDIAQFLDAHTETAARYDIVGMLEEFRKSLLRELDYTEEARHLLVLGRNLSTFDRLVVPAPVEDYTTSRVLTMEYVPGSKVTALSPVVLLEIDGAGLADQLFAAYLKQILVDGFFHADPHPGNIILTEDGRLALLDLGMVARITPRVQDHLLQLLLAVSEGRVDDVGTYAVKLGQLRSDFDQAMFARRIGDIVGRSQDAAVDELDVGTMVLELVGHAARSGLRLPPELSMLGKALLNLDMIGRTLDPAAQPNALIRRNAAAILQRRLLSSLSPGNLFSGLLESKELVERLPARLNRILDRLAENQFEVKVDAIDEARLMAGFQKVANRITLGLVLAALIIGAAMLMHVPTSFQILGYPGLAIIFFVLAAAGGVALMVSIVFGDD